MFYTLLASRTDFSLGESILSAESLVSQAEAVGQTAVAMTDTMSITGMIEFSKKAKAAGVKPIIGARLRVSENALWRPNKDLKETRKHIPKDFYLTFYVRSDAGMKALFRLLTLGNDEAHFYYRSKLDIAEIVEEARKLTAADYALVLGDEQGIYQHKDFDAFLAQCLAERLTVYLPFVAVNTPYYGRINQRSVDLHEAHGLPLLAIRPAIYGSGEADAQEVMTAICEGTKASDGWFRSRYNRDLHPMSLQDFVGEAKKAAQHLVKRGSAGAGAAAAKALQETVPFVDAVTYEWSKQEPSLPKLAADEFKAVVAECQKGFVERFKKPMFGHTPSRDEQRDLYIPRLKYELGVLENLGFSPYFLTVQDIVRFAKKSGIRVGPGRGSVGGSLVAYLMGITDIDPIRFGLLFERFINPERLDLPDADLDFMSERRHEIVEYLVKKFGADRVAGVSNFGTLGAASTIRDVGRVMGIPEREFSVSKFVPKAHGISADLPTARKEVAEIADFANNNALLWPIMERLEGSIRNMSQHAAGIVVAGAPLTEFAVVEKRKEGAVVCWDKRVIEEQGLVKIDLLGLSTLDVIDLACRYVKEGTGIDLDLEAIPLDDPAVLEAFSAGLTTGIFQYEGGGARRMLRDMFTSTGVALTFDDVGAVSALNRPGPLEAGLDKIYIEGRAGNVSNAYPSKYVTPILAETFGAIVYQEQIMQISKDVSGFTGAEADTLRKAIGKKDQKMMEKMEVQFVEGAIAGYAKVETPDGRIYNIHRTRQSEVDAVPEGSVVTKLDDGMEPHVAAKLWGDILGFAAYSFNKSHTYEYALISYMAMYLKVNHPLEFYAATMTVMGEDKLLGLMRDAKQQGVTICYPDVNKSTTRFELNRHFKEVVIPFQRIKGVSTKTADAILEARKSGPFLSKADFIARVEKRLVNVRVQGALDMVGAFASIEPSQPSQNDPSRIKDQTDLLPGLVSNYVPISREMNRDKVTRAAIEDLVDDYRAKHGPGAGFDGIPCKPHFGRSARIMIVTDTPNAQEEADGIMGMSRSYEAAREAMGEVDLSMADVYWTSLIKRPKSGKQTTGDEIALYKPYFEREMELLKPTAIVLLGSQAVRQFIPTFKGKASDAAGDVIYFRDLDANVVIGFSCGEIYHAPEKQDAMNKVFSVAKELIQ